jgi:hypothetical protein
VSTICLLLVCSLVAASDPAGLLEQLARPELDTGAAISVRDVEFELGPALLTIQRGFMVPAGLRDGRPIELVFVGQARIRMRAPDSIEAGQLELFTGQTEVDAAIEEAVLVLADESLIASVREQRYDQDPRPELLARATALHERWLDSTERRKTGVDAAMFKALSGDSAFQGYFAAWCRSFEVGEFLYRLDPEDVEQVTLASFNPVRMGDWERHRLRHTMRVQRRKGRWLGWRMEDVGNWDIWLSTSWDAAGGDTPGREGFEALHYELDATIRRDRMMLDGTARLSLEAQGDGRRAVRLELQRDLLVEEVRDEYEHELFFFRSGDEIVVLLQQPVRKGETLRLEVDYSGRALSWIDGKNFDLADTGTWYPHAGTIDRATYDVTLRWPRKYKLLAGGRLVDSGRDRRYLWERRKLDVPAIAYSFVLGDFDIQQVDAGHVKLTVGFNRTSSARTSPATQTEVIETLKSSLEFFEATFGRYPLDELTVATVPRRFSQSYLGFVTLARSMVGYGGRGEGASSWFRDTTIAHELAHQWWGNLLGWWSYRDQWLSEGMANYAALAFEARTREPGRSLLSVISSGWSDSLAVTTRDGRTIESLGPVVLGNRLNSSKAAGAYRPIVYRKGAVVLAMLARAVGEERFHEMLFHLVDAATDRVLTTESFLHAIERMSGLDLDGFARQYVYGTGIPQVYYDYALEETQAGGWLLQGEARRLSVPRFRYEIVGTPESGWDLQRELIVETAAGPTTLMVPFQVTLDAGLDAADRFGEVEVSKRSRSGQLFLEGDRYRFEIETVRRPTGLQLDPHGEILAAFFSASHQPKRYLRYQAQDLTLAGEFEAAEAGFRRALLVPVAGQRRREPSARAAASASDHAEDLRIRISLARLYLEQGRRGPAHRELDAIDADLIANSEDPLPIERGVLRSWLEVKEGEHASARRRLRRIVRDATLAAEGDRRGDASLLRLATERQALTEAYGLLAIAALETGRSNEHRRAAEAAADRGVDVSGFTP